MRIFRIENDEGLGCYRNILFPDCTYTFWTDSHNSHADYKHPLPLMDGISLKGDSNYIFGFKSMDQLRKWFSVAELYRLYILGFTITEYEADEIKVGNYQVAFKRGRKVS